MTGTISEIIGRARRSSSVIRMASSSISRATVIHDLEEETGNRRDRSGELNAQALNCLKGARSISVTNLEQSREQLEILYMNDSQRQTV